MGLELPDAHKGVIRSCSKRAERPLSGFLYYRKGPEAQTTAAG